MKWSFLIKINWLNCNNHCLNLTNKLIIRAVQFLKFLSDPLTFQESQNLSMFLATQNRIRNTLRQAVQEVMDGISCIQFIVINDKIFIASIDTRL